MDVSSCANWMSYSFNNAVSLASICCFSLWWGGLKVSSSTFSNVIFSVVMLCVVGASGLSVVLGISLMVGSRWPTYSPFWKWYVYWCSLHTRIFTNDFPLMLCTSLMMLIFGSFPFVESWLLTKYAICPLIVWPFILIGMMPSCLGGILRVDLTIPIVAFCSQFLV